MTCLVKRCLAVIPACCLAACGDLAGAGRGAAANRSAQISVETTTIQRMSVQRKVDLSGTLVSPDEAKIASEVAGVVQKVAVELGQEVRRGDVLVQLESTELALALERAESGLRQTEAQLGIMDRDAANPPADDQIAMVRTAAANRDDARAQIARAEQLSARGLLPLVERDNAATRLKIAEASYQSAVETVRSLKASLQDRRAAYTLAQKKLNDAAIRAPVDGSVSERFVRPGTFIRENTPVITIVQLDPLKLSAAIQEKYAGAIHPGMRVAFRVESYPEAAFEGTVSQVSPIVDPGTRTFPLEAAVANRDRRLKPGFFANGMILTHADENVMAVSENAISIVAGVASVYVIEKGKIRQQNITVGEHQGPLFEVVSGIKGGEVLASSNLNQLATGVAVAPHEAGETGGPGHGGAAPAPRKGP